MNLSLERKIAVGLAVALLVLLLAGGLALRSAARLNPSFERVDHTHQVLNQLERVIVNVLGLQTTTRGFVLTGSEEILAAHERSRTEFAAGLENLRKLVTDNPAQLRRLDEVEAATRVALEIMTERIAARRARGLAAAGDTIRFIEGQKSVEKVRAHVQAMEDEERRLLDERLEKSDAAAVVNLTAVVITAGLAAALVLVAGVITRRELKLRRQTEAALRTVNQKLEDRVHQRTVELADANRALKTEMAERQQGEVALRDSEHRFRALIEHSADSISLIDAQNNILYLSPSVAAVEGYTADELAGHNGIENTHPDDLPLLHATVQKLLAAPGQPIPVLWRRRHKRGHWIWLEGVAVNFLHDPAIGGIVTNYRDVTARKRAEAALQESEQRFRTLTENLPDIVSRFDRNFRMVYANPARAKLTGRTAAESMGKTAIELGSLPGNAARLEAAFARVFASRQTERIEFAYDTPNGTTAWESTLVAETGADGAVASVLILSHDITERRHAEEKIREINATLEERVRARTAQIEAVNHELEAFSYSVSHDLRAPLRHIDGFAGLLTKRAASVLDDQGKRYLSTISEAARQMGRLIDDLLSFSRTGRTPLKSVELDQNALVRSTIQDHGYDRTLPPVTWAIDPLPASVADPALLRQVWVNLIDNAVKYSGKNPAPRIEIGYQPETTKQEAAFFIRDNGVGFDMKYAGKLFGVFQRLHSTEEFPGTGVGLAHVQRILVRHGGRVWAESKLGEGATFYFSLPAAAS